MDENQPKEINTWKKIAARIIPYNSKLRVFIKMGLQLFHYPNQIIYYMRPQKIMRLFFYLRHDGIKGVSRILDERLLMGADLKLKVHIQPDIKGKAISDYAVLKFPQFEEPVVSIIIPVYNQFSFTYSCLRALLNNSGAMPYEIIVADDCSTDLTVQIKSVVKNVIVTKTPHNSLFLRNCNYAAQYSRGKYLLFLNNDTQVQAGWLAPLVDILERNPSVGITGSRLVYPDGRLQEAGGIVWKDGSAWNYGNGNNPALPEYNYVKEVDYISGASLMIRKNIWEELGGFDVRFSPAYCEDSDLAFSVRRAGYSVVYQPLSVVVHFEGISNGTDLKEGTKSYQVINQKKFYEKWKNQLQKEQLSNGENVFSARDRSQAKKKILIIDHRVPWYDKDAGARNVFMYTKIFLDLGFRVTFMPDNYFPHQPYTSVLEQMGIEVLYGNYYFKYWDEWLKDNAKYFDYIYLNRPHIAIKYIDILKEYTKGKIIYFGHDLHYLRELREYEINGDKTQLESSQKWKKIEFDLINKADVVYVVGSYEFEVLKEQFPKKIIRNIPIFTYDPLTETRPLSLIGRKDLLFVGGFGHPPNIDAVSWFASSVFPKVLEKKPDIIWYIVGSDPPEKIQALQNDHIIFTGFVSDDELKELYRNCRLVVVPLRFGAGVKGKVVESIYYQCPTLTTPIGAEGLSLEEKAFAVSEPDNSFADKIIELYDDDEKLMELMRQCKTFINNNFTKERALEVVLKDIIS